MEALLRSLLAGQGIDTVAFLPFDRCAVIQPHLLPDNVKSAAVWLIPYYTGAHPGRNLSLYAVSKDYHLFAHALAEKLQPALEARFPEDTFTFFCDSSPINEVAAAVKTGLGVIGKNRLLISGKYGSFVFIGCMLTTKAMSEPFTEREAGHCPGCGACESACDFLGKRSDVCMSELNQRKVLTEEEEALVKSRQIRWGCDVCQEVCPMNKNVPMTPIPFFYEDQIETLTADMLEGMTKERFRSRAFAWRGKKTILRNISEDDSTKQDRKR